VLIIKKAPRKLDIILTCLMYLDSIHMHVVYTWFVFKGQTGYTKGVSTGNLTGYPFF